MNEKDREKIPTLGFKAGVPADLTIIHVGSWPWVVGANNTQYQFHPDKHVEILTQLRNESLREGDTIGITADIGANKTVVFDCLRS
jgi:mitochondrial fission protein ELM1